MATLTIRRLDEKTKQRLRVRAARHGHSMEEEARDILRSALGVSSATKSNLADAIHQRFAAFKGVELKLGRRDSYGQQRTLPNDYSGYERSFRAHETATLGAGYSLDRKAGGGRTRRQSQWRKCLMESNCSSRGSVASGCSQRRRLCLPKTCPAVSSHSRARQPDRFRPLHLTALPSAGPLPMPMRRSPLCAGAGGQARDAQCY